MSAAEVVHPLDRSSRSGMRGGIAVRLVLYSLVGEEPEVVEDGKQRAPDTNFNAFPLPTDSVHGVRLHDVQQAFPLGGAFHFAFRNQRGVFVDITNPSAVVPTWDGKIVARVTPLVEAPSVKVVERTGAVEEEAEPVVDSVPDKDSVRAQYQEFQSFRGAPPTRSDEGQRDEGSDRRGWRAARAARPTTEDRSDDGAAKNAEWLRKQTEQAYDFAKKVSIEDAKKSATETAKKAKKWGASLLSSAKASLANAAGAVKNDTMQVGGVTVTMGRQLAEGAYAQVFLVRAQGSGESMALKRIICQSEEVERDVHTELQVLQNVKHLNVVPLIEFAEVRQQNLEFYFLFPYFERGSLWDSIQSATESSSPLWPFNQRVALHLFRGICAGVLALHRGGFCHRDLKPHNVLITSSTSGEDPMAFIPVITDFGSCAPIRVEIRSRKNSLDMQDEANRKSSAPYRAPELFEPTVDAVLDGQSDVWSLGCILYTMAFGHSPFEHPREGFMKLACMNGRVSFPPEQNGVVRHRSTQFSREFCDFIRDMLHTNPEERPSVLDALEFAEELLSDEMKR